MSEIREFQEGEKIKVPFQAPSMNKFKKGTFLKYSPSKKYGFFIHTKTGKTLRRKIELIQLDN